MYVSGENSESMTCIEFHKELPFLMESGTVIEDDPHLRSCENCTALVSDLRYIADQAKLLLPLHDPSPRVWNNIQHVLKSEGFTTEGRLSGPREIAESSRHGWMTFGWAATLAAALLVTVGLYQKNRTVFAPTTESGTVAPGSTAGPPSLAENDPDDAQLLSAIEQQAPSFKSVYAKNLRDVNAYIADAKSMVAEDPASDEANGHLREAYAQKAMLYEMATTRSLE